MFVATITAVSLAGSTVGAFAWRRWDLKLARVRIRAETRARHEREWNELVNLGDLPSEPS